MTGTPTSGPTGPRPEDTRPAPARTLDVGRLAQADRVARRREEGTGAGDGTVSQRNPYRPTMKRTWFLATKEYRAYFLREGAAVVVGLFVLNLMLGMVSMAAGLDSWTWWVELQRNPFVLVLNVLALAAAVLHTVSWDQLTPSIIKVQRGTRFLADGWIIAQQVLLLVIFAAVMVAWLGGAWS
ncbi:hypothetical protein [Miniimonas sp. S16]|uniref:hypothetical protein n=1 Tax=Miniimonas sp. S16 TaxID=2171623 RepID=UPI000D525A3C|nr:hypothetical protein [Miniimonas sp. S16]